MYIKKRETKGRLLFIYFSANVMDSQLFKCMTKYNVSFDLIAKKQFNDII